MIQTNLIPKFDGKLADLMDPYKRVTAKFFVDVKGGVMNGDPDRNGRPRVHPVTGKGLFTDCAQKRIVRDAMSFLIANGYEVKAAKDDPYTYGQLYVAHRGILNKNNEAVYKACGVEGYQEAQVGLPDKLVEKVVTDDEPNDLPNAAYALAKADNGKWLLKFDGSLDTEARGEAVVAFSAIDRGFGPLLKKLHGASKTRTQSDETLGKLVNQLCAMYQDVRLFGAVASTGNSCGNVKGPFQFHLGVSVDPLETLNMSITRVAVTRIEDIKIKRQEMGRKEQAPYGLYECTFTYTPALARRVGGQGITPEDLRLFWTAMYNFGQFSGSAMRGHIELCGLYAFVHEHPLGNAHDHPLYGRIKAYLKDPEKQAEEFSDYTLAVNEENMPAGVKLLRVYERTEPNRAVPPPKPPKLGG